MMSLRFFDRCHRCFLLAVRCKFIFTVNGHLVSYVGFDLQERIFWLHVERGVDTLVSLQPWRAMHVICSVPVPIILPFWRYMVAVEFAFDDWYLDRSVAVMQRDRMLLAVSDDVRYPENEEEKYGENYLAGVTFLPGRVERVDHVDRRVVRVARTVTGACT